MADAMKIAGERQTKIDQEIAAHQSAIAKLHEESEHLAKFLEFGQNLISDKPENDASDSDPQDDSNIAIAFRAGTESKPSTLSKTRMPSRDPRPISQSGKL